MFCHLIATRQSLNSYFNSPDTIHCENTLDFLIIVPHQCEIMNRSAYHQNKKIIGFMPTKERVKNCSPRSINENLSAVADPNENIYTDFLDIENMINEYETKEKAKKATKLLAKTRKTRPISLKEALEHFQKVERKGSEAFSYCNDVCPITSKSWKMNSISIGTSAAQGRRRYMEDCKTVMNNIYDEDNLVLPHYCSIFDGHIGSIAASMAASSLFYYLAENTALNELLWNNNSSDFTESECLIVKKAIYNAFLEMDSHILRITKSVGRSDGCTALVCLFRGNNLFVGNLGDTRAIISRNNEAVERLSIDHKPDLEVEKARIQKAGGKVINYGGCWRISHPTIQHRLAVSRALGDHLLKENLQFPLVSAEPYVTSITLTPRDHFLILASDGIWDVFSDDSAAAFVRNEMRKKQHARTNSCTSEVMMKEIANSLIEAALEAGSRDNITVIIVKFEWNEDCLYVCNQTIKCEKY